MTTRAIFLLLLATTVWNGILGLQRPPPRYSQQYMPQTSFTCRNKIVGSYYADPETDCQLFHVCVSVAGSIQDYRFLCPNDTAFDQESQTCADWYDVDCEAATLYYASDNFDLYRIGSGLESLHYDSIRSDYEPQDHLQRSESNDPIRSQLNSLNSNNYKDSESTKKNSIKNNQFASRNQNQANGEVKKDMNLQENQEHDKKVNIRKINRKPANNGFTAGLTSKSATNAPSPTQKPYRYNDQQSFTHTTAASLRPSPLANAQRSNQASIPTQRSSIKYAATQTATKSTGSQDAYSNYQTTITSSTFQNTNYNHFETTAKTTKANGAHLSEPHSYSVQLGQSISSTTKQPPVDYQQYNQANYDKRVYNNNFNNNDNVHRTNNTSLASSTSVPNYYNNQNNNKNSNNYDDNNNYNNNYNNHHYNKNIDNHQLSKKSDDLNVNSYTTKTYAPTTYNPITKKHFESSRQYYDKSTTSTPKVSQYIDTDSSKVAKKVTKAYQNYETSTKSYDFTRSSVGLGFSPSSVNHLAENVRPTTPTPRRNASPTTYNPNNFHLNLQAPKSRVTPEKSSYNPNQSSKQFSTTAKYAEETTTVRFNKITKKNDYDYAYYDNGPLEYDSIELEHVGSNKESVKIT